MIVSGTMNAKRRALQSLVARQRTHHVIIEPAPQPQPFQTQRLQETDQVCVLGCVMEPQFLKALQSLQVGDRGRSHAIVSEPQVAKLLR